MKVALLGSAPSSVGMAPFHDPEWQIWACSPGVYGTVGAIGGRTDQYFELHRWRPPTPGKPGSGDPWFSPEYCQFLRQHPKVWVADPNAVGDIPNAQLLPFQQLVGKYGPYFFTSSLTWMFAMALEAGATMIGMWGVDMSATEEYGYQRAGCQYFVQLAVTHGVQVVVPPESDLLVPPPLYGVCEIDHQWIKLLARKQELLNRLNEVTARDTATKGEYHFVMGALDDLNYMMNTWTHNNAQVPQFQMPKKP